MVRWTIAAMAALWATSVGAMDRPHYAPAADWVKAVPIPSAAPSGAGVALQNLLNDSQTRFGADGDDFYFESAFKVLTSQGLATAGNIPLSWNPDTESLTIHRLEIIRDGKRIDLLAGGKNVTVLRRETNLERAALDGRLTASLQPEGVQVGDLIDLAWTLRRRDPVYQGRSEGVIAIRHLGVAGRVHWREVWLNSKPIRWRAADDLPKPMLSQAGDTTELVIDQRNVTAPYAPRNAPERFDSVGTLELSQFQSWAEVASLMTPLYAKATTLGADSPVRAEAEKIRRSSSDPKARAQAALQLVQDKIHYEFLGMNFGGYVPANADLTWARRFGDCKGKTVVLLALLQELGITAEPALVSTGGGDGLGERLPRLGVFDHVMVRATIKDRVYWLDGTRIGDRDLNDIPLPDFHWVLPVHASGAVLEAVSPKSFDTPSFESIKRLDASKGYDAPAPAHMEHIFRGDEALGWHSVLENLDASETQRLLREYWRGQLPWIEPTTVATAYDDQRHVMRLSMDGQATIPWTQNDGVRDFQIDDSSIGFNTSFKREPGPHADAPIRVPYPRFRKWTVVITLPPGDIRLDGGPDVDAVIAGRHYERRSRIVNRVVTVMTQERTSAPEFPFAEAETAAAELRRLASRDVFVRGFNTQRPTASAAASEEPQTIPVSAVDYTVRGAGFLNHHDYDRAIADFTAAAELEPTAGKHLYNRAAARLQKGQDDLALVDLNRALELNPKDTLSYLARGDVLLAGRDKTGGWKDLDQAVSLAPSDVSVRARRAQAYERHGRFALAVQDLDTVLLASLPPERRGFFLNARCWVRAQWGMGLNQALTDCDAALALLPQSPAILDSRGFVNLRLRNYNKAIDDYDQALALSPATAASLYGRGLAKLHDGRRAEGAADLAAARAAASGVEAQFASYGLGAP